MSAVGENVRVAVYELFAHPVGDVVKIEAVFVARDVGVERNLHKQIAQLLAQRAEVLFVDGVGGLVRLLEHVEPDGLVSLHLVPRAAVGRAQQMNYLEQVGDCVFVFKTVLNHSKTSTMTILTYKAEFCKDFHEFFTFWQH